MSPDILNIGHLPTTLISTTQVKYMLDQINLSLQKTNTAHILLCPDLYYYYDMQFISLGPDKDFKLLLQFLYVIESYRKKPLALCQLKTVPVLIKDNNTEANSYIWQQYWKDYLAITEKNHVFDNI